MKRVTLTCQLRPDFIESGLREVQENGQPIVYGTRSVEDLPKQPLGRTGG